MDEIEIPEAIRENSDLPEKSRLALSLPLILGLMLCLSLAGLLFMFFSATKPVEKVVDNPVNDSTTSPVTPKPQAKPEQPEKPESFVTEPIEQEQAKPSQEDLLGHLPYDVASESALEAITMDGSLKMKSSAANKFKQMQAAAKADGVILTPISAFRTAEDQEQLFFAVKEQRVQDAAKRAEVSAPPGYSEHHTGYAIDIGDANAPTTNLEPEFANTAAFRWLEKNALKYSFELSFPPNNKQGVSYEPWHWRFVGDRHSLETFYKVRK